MEMMLGAFKQRIQSSQLGSISTFYYLGIKFNKETDDCLSFWVRYQKSFDKLFVPALVALSIPASMQCTCGRAFSFFLDRVGCAFLTPPCTSYVSQMQ
jgi:hypothetical protein